MESTDESTPESSSIVTNTTTSTTTDGTPGSYTLRELICDVPLSTDEQGVKSHITCVDAWNGNLYIGTSSGQILHYVSIPPDPSDDSSLPSYIFATNIEPAYKQQQEGADQGVKQILILPNAGKACIVCNSTLTFYTLPELSPAYDGRIQQAGCLWVGGLDLNEEAEEGSQNGTVVVICLRQRLRLIRIGDEASPRKIRDIELGGVSALQRRGDLACVADGTAYSLLDVVNQRKNELFTISSLSEPVPPPPELPPGRPPANHRSSRSVSSQSPARPGRGHQRNVSLGNQLLDSQVQQNSQQRAGSPSAWPVRGSSRLASPAAISSRESSPAKSEEPIARPSMDSQPPSEAVAPPALLPNILSPTSNEFLLTTGTRENEPGVGMFVNLEGDVVRGTIEFTSYPHSVVLDRPSQQSPQSAMGDPSDPGYVLAVVRRQVNTSVERCIEIQQWNADPGEAQRTKEWLVLDTITEDSQSDGSTRSAGLRNASTSAELAAEGVTGTLRLRRLKLGNRKADESESNRNKEEDGLAGRFAQTQANVLLFADDKVSWIVRTPLIAQLNGLLGQAMQQVDKKLTIDVSVVQRVFNSMRGQEPRDELEFLTLTYARQKSALLLFGNLVLQTAQGVTAYEHDKRRAEDALTSSDLDPRIVLTLVTPFDEEIAEGTEGIWMPQGLRDTIEILRDSFDASNIVRESTGPYVNNLLNVVKPYLMLWRKKKGFGSVADEVHVFKTVDAALLHLLLVLDQNSPRGPAIAGSVRAELNDVVDKGVDCFDRAVELFEQFHRLYVLSRLYQSRKMVSHVLATWKRIIEGEQDAGGELVEGEQHLRRYLTKIRDPALVQEYGAWLANRNPKVGVQIFADETSRVKFQPTEAVAILKEKAPGAVKDYLEHLVFGKNHIQYVNDLIAFYLDTVLAELESSATSRNILLDSYSTYRALQPPKPTYRQFITDNSLADEWWHNRLRLLQLLDGSHGAATAYDLPSLTARLAPYKNLLVPESIILHAREADHDPALRLLVHGLADYDTAIRYCLLAGSTIFHPSSSHSSSSAPLPTKEEQSHLFHLLLEEFFKIPDLGDRIARSAELLDRFGAWFDVEMVLDKLPDDWAVDLVEGFLVAALRGLVTERNESAVERALWSARHLRVSAEGVDKRDEHGGFVLIEKTGHDDAGDAGDRTIDVET
ncbi:unnamed protein product [Zymoseptoria tritici ST99CH_3D1]|nr:unnamed protein product [Zymoseptoria tritici ST99CH_3D1]